ncbi:tyrosine-type recombinase/integrase [Achromobacter xylosoxidans]|nr:MULTISPECIES: site-specific integrase [Achromobacter]CAB3831223.1 Tyrosine recombinase XerC [Achromobacter denitrificans]CAB3873592.1 Tyrosine recombinase XerC [Achromobacter pulmonis]CUI90973.1 site-specific tyrosine recombinase XerD [Achromobacter xylosoxidans]
MPVLVDTRVGMPLFNPTVYALTQLRGRNLAANTIVQALRHIMVFILFLEQRGIDLDARLQKGHIVDLAEIESLVRTCYLRLADMGVDEGAKATPAGLVSLERIRRGFARQAAPAIDPDSVGNRVRRIADYLSWMASAYLLRLPFGNPALSALESSRQQVIGALRARAPSSGGRTVLDAREGLSPEVSARLLEVTARNSLENPWAGEFTKLRNELIFRWMYSFGLRRGELLNVKVSDVNFRKETVVIIRRADAPEDPRQEQPTVKTRDRLLPMAPDLCRLTHDYVIHARSRLKGARKHEYLFVADKTGAPMSLSTLNKCFAFLRTKIRELPDDFSPHVLRHTWNDNFSAAMDRLDIPAAEEQKMRSFLMGWSETSDSAQNYTRRHVREKAKKVSLHLQADMAGKVDL